MAPNFHGIRNFSEHITPSTPTQVYSTHLQKLLSRNIAFGSKIRESQSLETTKIWSHIEKKACPIVTLLLILIVIEKMLVNKSISFFNSND